MKLSVGKGSFRVKGHLGTSEKEASGIRGAWAFLGRLTLGPGPVGVIGLGRLARRTEPGPMVPIKKVR